MGTPRTGRTDRSQSTGYGVAWGQRNEWKAVKQCAELTQHPHRHAQQDAERVTAGLTGSGSEEDPRQRTLTAQTSRRKRPG